ncbi:hypothetical protein AF72_12105 [Xylella taiwanensis]|uniref:Transposase n=1 Tax=Xylella taiwanensis TaxID=1444770 RepID=Z9JHA4_9GAMM|nr:hypothetical protein AB672_07760 [Xylella taiwanensis]EWS77206.1 hypothetical protein AF72_12105 [Xylella taiwanensis]
MKTNIKHNQFITEQVIPIKTQASHAESFIASIQHACVDESQGLRKNGVIENFNNKWRNQYLNEYRFILLLQFFQIIAK